MDETSGDRKNRRHWLQWVLLGLIILGLIVFGVWSQRAPIAENFISRELSRLDVRAAYDLRSVGLRTQRIENIVLGDPNHPDLTARWVEVDIALTGLTPTVEAIRAGGVRMRAAFRNGLLHLGELDKFRDPSSNAPFTLPDIVVALQDARLRVDSDAGSIGMRIDGQGNLRSGFAGKLAAVMPEANIAGCGASKLTAWLDVRTSGGRPRLFGPLRSQALGCKNMDTAVAFPTAAIDVTLGKEFDRWNGAIRLNSMAVKSGAFVLATPYAKIDFNGDKNGTRGRLNATAEYLSAVGGLANEPSVNAVWSVEQDHMKMQGRVAAKRLQMKTIPSLAKVEQSTNSTPVGPLVTKFVNALQAASRDNDLRTNFAVAQRGQIGKLALSDTRFSSKSGAHVSFASGGHLLLSWPSKKGGVDWALNGAVTSGGGGLPEAALRLAKRESGGFGGQLFVEGYSANNARLVLDTVRFTSGPNGETSFSTNVKLDGPLPDGMLRGLQFPLEGRVTSSGEAFVNPHCTPIRFTSAKFGSFALGEFQQRLCPINGLAMLQTGASGMRGGAELSKIAIHGQNANNPVHLSADHARFTLDKMGFDLGSMKLSLGLPDAGFAMTANRLDGKLEKGSVVGSIHDATARIGVVPLLIGHANGRYAFAGSALNLKAALQVRDAEETARFNPMAVPDFILAMVNGKIQASGTLQTLLSGTKVATTKIHHDLNNGRGNAELIVDDLQFNGRLQPDDITALTVGLIANVAGTVNGSGHIRWDGSNVTSVGRFRTDSLNLAAAFGPVEGIKGEVHFTDLLGLVSAPSQVAQVRSVNPGVEVRDGEIRYRLGAGQKVHIEGGGWPFSGGQLSLLPTVMDFSADVDRYLTFRVLGLDAGAFIQAMELDNISATGTFDGILPLIFNARGGRVAGGVLVARQEGMPPLIMPEGVLPTIPCDPTRISGTLSYVGPVSNEQLGTMGHLAFDALKNMQYKCLTILMDGALDGEMVTNVVFNGINKGQIGTGPVGLAKSFTGLPFLFNVKISAPFRGLMGTAQSLVNPSALLQESVGNQVQENIRQGLAVNPAESDTMGNRKGK